MYIRPGRATANPPGRISLPSDQACAAVNFLEVDHKASRPLAGVMHLRPS
jgi:hypothetical protein